jgi:hypothetical protein
MSLTHAQSNLDKPARPAQGTSHRQALLIIERVYSSILQLEMLKRKLLVDVPQLHQEERAQVESSL